MSDQNPDLQWITEPAAPAGTAVLEQPATPPQKGLSSRVRAAGIFVTALVVGAVGVFTLQSSSASPTATDSPGGGGFGGPPGFAQNGPGGTTSGTAPGGFGGRGASGTVTAVSSTSITVSGQTYSVSASGTEVVVDGRQGSLADIHRGDTAFVHAHGTAAERVFVGGMPAGGPGFPPGQQPGQQPGAGAGATTTT